MRIANRMKWVVWMIALLMVALPGSLVMAQGEDEGDPEFNLEFEFEGTIVSITEEAILVDVDGIEFVLAPAGSFRPSTLVEGDLVRFNGVMLNDDTIQVSELEIVEEDTDEETGEDIGEDVGEDAEEDTGEEGDIDTCGKEDHPVITALAEEFELEADVVAGYFCDGNGVGEVARALALAKETDLAVEDIFAMREDGMGWGNIVKELEVSPSALAPGHQVKHQRDGEQEQEQAGESSGPGNSANAPGQNKENNGGQGNSANAPGQNKDDQGGGQGSGNGPKKK